LKDRGYEEIGSEAPKWKRERDQMRREGHTPPDRATLSSEPQPGADGTDFEYVNLDDYEET
jgi:hypothetical protein